MTMMPESRSRTFNFTWMRPVIQPAKAPTAKEMNNAATGEMVPMKGSPFAIPAAVTAAPRGKVPSTDRSGKSRILYVM